MADPASPDDEDSPAEPADDVEAEDSEAPEQAEGGTGAEDPEASEPEPEETDADDSDTDDPAEEETQTDGWEDGDTTEEESGEDDSETGDPAEEVTEADDSEAGEPEETDAADSEPAKADGQDTEPAETDGSDGDGEDADGQDAGGETDETALVDADEGLIGDEGGGGGLFGLEEKEGPMEDEEMPLTAHIEEMLKRLAIVVAVAGVVSMIVFPFAEVIINFLWNSVLPSGELTRPRLYGVLELWFTKVKVASLAGLIIALPVLVYQTYRFMRPGLYPHERRYYLAAVPTSLVLALVGVAFAYFIVLPGTFSYFLYYSQDVAVISFALGRTFNLILILMAYLAIVFQIPLLIMLAMIMGLVTRQWLADRRLLFWGAFLGLSFIFSPDPTGMVPIVIAATMIGLFEGTLLLTKWTRRGQGKRGTRA